MARWIQVLVALFLCAAVAGCATRIDGIGHQIPTDEALRMAKQGSPLTQVTGTESYTGPPTVHVVRGTDRDGKPVIVWVYTSVIRYVYADTLITATQARDVAERSGFPVKAVSGTSLRVFQGTLDGRANPVFWLLSTKAGWIWVDAETGTILRRLDAALEGSQQMQAGGGSPSACMIM